MIESDARGIYLVGLSYEDQYEFVKMMKEKDFSPELVMFYPIWAEWDNAETELSDYLCGSSVVIRAGKGHPTPGYPEDSFYGNVDKLAESWLEHFGEPYQDFDISQSYAFYLYWWGLENSGTRDPVRQQKKNHKIVLLILFAGCCGECY